MNRNRAFRGDPVSLTDFLGFPDVTMAIWEGPGANEAVSDGGSNGATAAGRGQFLRRPILGRASRCSTRRHRCPGPFIRRSGLCESELLCRDLSWFTAANRWPGLAFVVQVSAAEVRAALRVAVAWGYIEATAVAPAEQLLDRVAAMSRWG